MLSSRSSRPTTTTPRTSSAAPGAIHSLLLYYVTCHFVNNLRLITSFPPFLRCLDAILHAEHKRMLEEMRTSYMLTQRHRDEEEEQDDTDTASGSDYVNGKAGSGFFGITQLDGTLFLTRSVDLRTLLGLTPDPDSQTR